MKRREFLCLGGAFAAGLPAAASADGDAVHCAGDVRGRLHGDQFFVKKG